MEKVKLDSEEREFLTRMRGKQEDIMKIKLDMSANTANFWKEFQEKHGFGSYKMDIEKIIIFSLSREESKIEEKNN